MLGPQHRHGRACITIDMKHNLIASQGGLMNKHVRSGVVWTVLVGAISLVCSGCAQTVTVTASGKRTVAEAIPQQVTYTVLPTTEVAKDPAFPAYATLISEKMQGMGYKKTSEKTAQLGVFLAYGSTAKTTAPTTMGSPTPPMGAGGGMGTPGAGGGSYGMAASTPAGAAGMPQYQNQLVIVVVDMKKSSASGAAVELWRGDTLQTGNSNDLTNLAPLMVEAAFRHFGETTATAVSHRFSPEEIVALHKGK
jgi:hypothetical protein